MARSLIYQTSATFGLSIVILLASVWPSTSSQFLARTPGGFTSECALLSEIEVVLGSDHVSFMEKRVGRIEESMRNTYAAVAKNEYGRLGHAAANYVLHRFFVHRHAWSVQGLDPAGESMVAFSSSTATKILENRVPKTVLNLFEECIVGQGFGLTELAVLAAMLEHLVHKEAIERLRMAYESLNFSDQDVLSGVEVENVMDSYMAYYLLASVTGNASHMTAEIMAWTRGVVEKVYPTWNQTQKFLREVTSRIAPNGDYMPFADVALVVEEIGEIYGRWQDSECRTIKDMLVEFEDVSAAGRVRLSDFYSKVLYEGTWQFGESLHSLRRMGAIDDTDPTDLRVIIPNYVYSPTNCVAGSIYYSVCCIDECDDLLADLEGSFSKHELSAEEIAAHISAMPSTTVLGNRTLPAWLLHRLDEVAAHHAGLVPLHGRLFAQWMHFAYPRECRYPHVAGTTDPSKTLVSIENFEENSATNEEMQQYVNAAVVQKRAAANDTTLATAEDGLDMWTMEEELVVSRPSARVDKLTALSVVLRTAVFIGLLAFALVVTLTDSVGLDGSCSNRAKLRKHCV